MHGVPKEIAERCVLAWEVEERLLLPFQVLPSERRADGVKGGFGLPHPYGFSLALGCMSQGIYAIMLEIRTEAILYIYHENCSSCHPASQSCLCVESANTVQHMQRCCSDTVRWEAISHGQLKLGPNSLPRCRDRWVEVIRHGAKWNKKWWKR